MLSPHAIALAVVATIACSCSPDQFQCYKTGPAEGESLRECAPSLMRCDLYGCFERSEAYCARYVFQPLDGPEKPASLCAPTLQECERWMDGRKSLSRCVVSRVDEYVR
jgi:hypothetical protein